MGKYFKYFIQLKNYQAYCHVLLYGFFSIEQIVFMFY